MSAIPARGDSLPERVLARIGPETMHAYLAVSGDDNPLHTNEALARAAGLSGVPVPGMMVMGLLGELLVDWQPEAVIERVSTSFAVPVLVEGELRLGGRVVAVDGVARTAIVRLTARQAGKVCVLGEAEIAFPGDTD